MIMLASCCSLQYSFTMVNEVTMKNNLLESFKPFVFKSSKHTVISYLDYPDAIVRNPHELHLYDIGNAWGNGAHPTTKLCIEFLEDGNLNCKDATLLDYGTGSGILSLIASNLGAKKCIAVDIDESSLEAAAANAKRNGFDNVIEVMHTRDVIVGDGSLPLSDFTIANIQPGPLSRLVAPLWLLTKPVGFAYQECVHTSLLISAGA